MFIYHVNDVNLFMLLENNKKKYYGKKKKTSEFSYYLFTIVLLCINFFHRLTHTRFVNFRTAL